MKQNAKICAIGVMKLEVFILGVQRIDQKKRQKGTELTVEVEDELTI